MPALYDKQRRFVEDAARYTACEAGTKSGKTLGCAAWLVKHACEQANTIWWWIAPSYAQAMIALDLIIHGDRMSANPGAGRTGPLPPLLDCPGQAKVRRSGVFPEMKLSNGSLIQFRTGADPNLLYGSSVSGVVIDEASRLSEAAFFAVRSTVTMSRGNIKIIGNPHGTRNWFYKLCQRAKAEGGNYAYHHLCSADNPFILAEEIEDARRLLPERVFRELYLGEAQEGEGQVFSHIADACRIEGTLDPVPGHRYVIGWDPARKEDYSAVSIFDALIQPFREAALERLSVFSFDVQLVRVKALSDRYFGAPVVFDATSMGGDLLAELVRNKGIPAIPFIFTADSKSEIVNRMVVALEQGAVLFQSKGLEADVARGEMELFEAKAGRLGRYSFGAPEGSHDDTVMARCLALHGIVHPVTISQKGIFDYFKGQNVSPVAPGSR